jgi:hypothetical protein
MRLVGGVSGILFRESLAAEGAVVFAKACELGLEGIVSKLSGQPLQEREKPQPTGGRESGFGQDVTAVARDTLPTFESRRS